MSERNLYQQFLETLTDVERVLVEMALQKKVVSTEYVQVLEDIKLKIRRFTNHPQFKDVDGPFLTLYSAVLWATVPVMPPVIERPWDPTIQDLWNKRR